MDYNSHIKRTLISFFQFMSVAFWFLYLYFILWDFAAAARAFVKSYPQFIIPLMTYFLYSVSLVFLPTAIIYTPRRSTQSKDKLFRLVTSIIAAILIIGSIGDLFIFNFFINYVFQEGHAIFCNLVVYIPNLLGTLSCLIMALAYILFGRYLTKNRLIAFLLYLLIFIIELIPLVYMHFNNTLRIALIKKAALIFPHQICLLISLTLAFPSELLWTDRIK